MRQRSRNAKEGMSGTSAMHGPLILVLAGVSRYRSQAGFGAGSGHSQHDWASEKEAAHFGVPARFASSCTDFVVADLSIVDLTDKPHAAGGFVICLANIG
jgi:hypothetical protein